MNVDHRHPDHAHKIANHHNRDYIFDSDHYYWSSYLQIGRRHFGGNAMV